MCKKHPKYKAIRIPRINCEECWKMWEDKHPGFKKVAKVPKKTPPKKKCGRCEGNAVKLVTDVAGNKWWYQNGKLHRTDGPAVEYSDGDKEWYIDEEEYTKEEFKRYLLIIELAGLK